LFATVEGQGLDNEENDINAKLELAQIVVSSLHREKAVSQELSQPTFAFMHKCSL